MKKKDNLLVGLLPILCLTIAILSLVSSNSLGQNLKFKERFSKQKESIELSSSIDEQTLCSNGDLRLKISLTIKNLQNIPIVFCKDCMSDVGLFVSNDVDSLYQDKFVYDLDSFGEGKKFNLSTPSPFEKPFVTLKNGEVFTAQLEPYLLNMSGEKTALKSGTYIFVQTISTWADSSGAADSLRKQWKSERLFFWTDNLISEPIVLQINTAKMKTCQ